MQEIANNVFHLIVNAMVTFGGLNVEQLGAMFISMGCDGNNVFQGGKVGVIDKGECGSIFLWEFIVLPIKPIW